jgi:hypothetical protein
MCFKSSELTDSHNCHPTVSVKQKHDIRACFSKILSANKVIM